MTEPVALPALPDEFFASDESGFSYHFLDKNNKPIPNRLGWLAVGYLKTQCMHDSRPVIFHTDVNPILARYSREELVQLVAEHGMPYQSTEKKATKKAAASHEELPEVALPGM